VGGVGPVQVGLGGSEREGEREQARVGRPEGGRSGPDPKKQWIFYLFK
jgi:hypothetical protein